MILPVALSLLHGAVRTITQGSTLMARFRDHESFRAVGRVSGDAVKIPSNLKFLVRENYILAI
jgi:hypothetical protein